VEEAKVDEVNEKDEFDVKDEQYILALIGLG
jgi:hypothetical protein